MAIKYKMAKVSHCEVQKEANIGWPWYCVKRMTPQHLIEFLSYAIVKGLGRQNIAFGLIIICLKHLNCLWCLNYFFCGILLVRWREAWRWPPGGRECLKFQALASEWNLPLPLKFVKPTLRPLFTNKSVLEQSSVCEALGIESAVPTFMWTEFV